MRNNNNVDIAVLSGSFSFENRLTVLLTGNNFMTNIRPQNRFLTENRESSYIGLIFILRAIRSSKTSEYIRPVAKVGAVSGFPKAA